MRRAIVGVVTIVVLGVTGCSSELDTTACKAALKTSFDAVWEGQPDPTGGKAPGECKGLDDKTVRELGAVVFQEKLKG